VNSEPEIGNILAVGSSDSKGPTVTRSDFGAVLSVSYDDSLRTVKIKCDGEGIAVLAYYVEVKLNAGGVWYYIAQLLCGAGALFQSTPGSGR
jgi:hypothetical protein